MRVRREPFAQFTEFWMQPRKKFAIGIPSPVIIEHRFMTGGTNADLEFIRCFSARKHSGNPVRYFNPTMCGVENFWSRPQAMKNFAEEPFAAVSATALSQVLRSHLRSQLCDLRGFLDSGMILPKPGHSGRVFGKTLLERERVAVQIDRQRSAPRCIHTKPNHLLGFETSNVLSRILQRSFQRFLCARHIILRMLSGEIRIV